MLELRLSPRLAALDAGGAGAGARTARGGLLLRDRDANPERVVLGDVLAPLPGMNVGDRLPGAPNADWEALEGDYRLIRRHIEAVIPHFEDFEARIDVPGGFRLPHAPHERREFATASRKANFSPTELWWPKLPQGRLLLQTLRSHDQFNTTIYGLSDRYRGIEDGRRVVFLHEDDIRDLGWSEGDVVDLVSEWEDGTERRAAEFRIVRYDTPRGCAAAYYPETNPLVPLDFVAAKSNTPVSKGITVRLVAA